MKCLLAFSLTFHTNPLLSLFCLYMLHMLMSVAVLAENSTLKSIWFKGMCNERTFFFSQSFGQVLGSMRDSTVPWGKNQPQDRRAALQTSNFYIQLLLGGYIDCMCPLKFMCWSPNPFISGWGMPVAFPSFGDAPFKSHSYNQERIFD